MQAGTWGPKEQGREIKGQESSCLISFTPTGSTACQPAPSTPFLLTRCWVPFSHKTDANFLHKRQTHLLKMQIRSFFSTLLKTVWWFPTAYRIRFEFLTSRGNGVQHTTQPLFLPCRSLHLCWAWFSILSLYVIVFSELLSSPFAIRGNRLFLSVCFSSCLYRDRDHPHGVLKVEPSDSHLSCHHECKNTYFWLTS